MEPLLDMLKIDLGMAKSKAKASSVTVEALTLFESIAHIMARHADPDNVPKEINDWLMASGPSLSIRFFRSSRSCGRTTLSNSTSRKKNKSNRA